MELTVSKDLDDLTMTVVATFEHPVEQVWQLYADPRRLERWWGPPSHPATVVEHDLAPGGRVHYFMTSPDGERYHGLWTVQQVDAPRSFTVVDAFADENGTPAEDMPASTMAFSFAETSSGSRMTTVTTFSSLDALEQVLAMGMEEGLTQSMGQMEDVLATS